MSQENSYLFEFACFASFELLGGDHSTRREGNNDYIVSFSIAIIPGRKSTKAKWVTIHSQISGRNVYERSFIAVFFFFFRGKPTTILHSRRHDVMSVRIEN